MAQVIPTVIKEGSVTQFYTFTLANDTDYAEIDNKKVFMSSEFAVTTIGLLIDDIVVEAEMGPGTGLWAILDDEDPITDGYIYEKACTRYSGIRILRNGGTDGPITVYVSISK